MRKRLTIAISLLAVVAIIAGGTFAWFTATTDPVTNEFKAGTLKINLVDEFEGATNVNPGDCYEKEVYVENTGSKRAVVRIAKNMFFDNDDLDLDVVEYELGEYWLEHEDGYFYYDMVLQPGKKTKPLFKDNKVCFNGPEMDNDYQGSKFSIVIKADAIQATNGAPTTEGWKVDPLAAEH